MAKKTRKRSAKETVRRALHKVPADFSLDSLYKAIPASAKKTKTWKATVRRTLQELRASGEIGFEASQRGAGNKRGHYIRPDRKLAPILAKLTRTLEFAFTIVSSSAEPVVQHLGAFTAHVYDFMFSPDEETEGASVVVAAVRSLFSDYPSSTTAVSIYVEEIDLSTGDVTDEHWITLGPWAPNPRVAADQLEFEFEKHSRRGKYRVSENILGLSIMVREP